jgi:hypothetical protein
MYTDRNRNRNQDRNRNTRKKKATGTGAAQEPEQEYEQGREIGQEMEHGTREEQVIVGKSLTNKPPDNRK